MRATLAPTRLVALAVLGLALLAPLVVRKDQGSRLGMRRRRLENMKIARGNWRIAIGVLAFSAGGVLACWDVDSVRPMERETARVHRLFEEGRYAELDRLSNPLDVLSDGQPRSQALLDGVAPDNIDCRRRTQSMEEGRLKAFPAYRQKMAAWSRQQPNSTFAKIALARVPYQEAQVVRGNGWASEVLPEAWEPFRKLIAESERQLDTLPAQMKRDPLWYLSMLQVALMASWKEPRYRALLDEAIARYPDNSALHFKGLEYYSGRWGGSIDDQKKFIERSVARAGPTAGDVLYARMQWYEESRQMFQSGQADWIRMKAGFQQMVAKYPDAWNLNQFAKFACLALDREVLASVMPRISPGLIQVWKDQRYFDYCKGIGNRDPAGPDINAAPGASTLKIVRVLPPEGSVWRVGDRIDLEVSVGYSLDADTGTIALVAQAARAVLASQSQAIKRGSGTVTLEASIVVPETKAIEIFTALSVHGQGTTSTVDRREFKVLAAPAATRVSD